MDLTSLVAKAPQLQALWPKLSSGRHLMTGLSGSAKTVVLAAARQTLAVPLLVVTDTRAHAEELTGDLTRLLGESAVWAFPVEDVAAAELAVASPDARNERINTLRFLQTDGNGVVVTTINGLRTMLPRPEQFEAATVTIDLSSEVDLPQLASDLAKMGYHRNNLVDAPGQFAIRGGIIDVYPLNLDNPVRIELFDTEVDSLRSFDMVTQRSLVNVERVTITPATELLADKAALVALGKRLTKLATAQKAKAATKEEKQQWTDQLLRVAAELTQGERPADLNLYLPWIEAPSGTLLDYFKQPPLVVMDEYSRSLDKDAVTVAETSEWFAGLVSAGRLPSAPAVLPLPELLKGITAPVLLLNLFQKGIGNLKLDSLTTLTSHTPPQFFGQLPLLATESRRWRKRQLTVVMLIGDQPRLVKLGATLREAEVATVESQPNELVLQAVQLVVGNLQNGFELPDLQLVVLTERELFNRTIKPKARHQTLANAERLKSYTELAPGDFVVHVNHGIGEYVGLKTMTVDGVHQDYITILYQKGDTLFIPVTQLDLVQKYVAADGKRPRINKLGGSEWQKTKAKVQSRVEDIADDLIKLYAAREAEPGFAFEPDDDMQRQFESEFPYPETADQLRSVKEIKRDMERPRPMDRLLVGDVGFGKTEVALRAAFKAVASGKQVALLVPTTILAQQHYDNMVERFADFPVTLGLLSRFKTRAQIKESLADLASGKLDIIIGTHRLLSKDVVYHDLGLLIVDEEQRFGVKHKERLKELKQSVDVLTLTATPIPRTLNMSMLGVRDLSVIETPPTNRYPIQTFVMERNGGAMREAIIREMERGGQVFYLHNRVADIEHTVAELQQLVPEATIAYAHGQMTETQLEGVIYDFLHGNYDILVTTTIIETGVDMPNVNTLIIEDADHYGLSQLYQLRGRIGRSSRVAYAYFMYQPNRVLSEEAEKRLQAIRDFTELGSGFKIAMRDLSIRGAGNLLGSQQHGFIDSVGYDLYTQMLKAAVAKKQGKDAPAIYDTEVSLGIEAYLPDDYVSDSRQKIELYKRLKEARSEASAAELQDDLIDRFGDYPQPVANLLAVAHLKRLADTAQLDKVVRLGDVAQFTFSQPASSALSGEGVFKALAATKLKAKVAMDEQRLVVSLKLKPLSEAAWLEELTAFTNAAASVVAEAEAA